jgi:dTDP-4-amino-4,6-dideoxygalactose transaminase
VALVGATPVFVDVEPDSGLIAPDSLRAALAGLRGGDLRPRAVIAVDLFSLPHDHRAVGAIAREHELFHYADCAHSIGTDTPDGPCGTLADGSATSFYPSKALGCYGDGGAVFAKDADRALRVRRIANHGIAPGEGAHLAVGTNSRLDTLQAAVLLRKLAAFDEEITARRAICDRYNRELANTVGVPVPHSGVLPVWSYYGIRHRHRDALQEHLKARGVASVAYYRAPLPDHPAFAMAPVASGGLHGTRAYTAQLLCLPSHPYMTDDEVGAVIGAVRSFRP